MAGNLKHLMTGPKGNSKFCFPETLNVPRGEIIIHRESCGQQHYDLVMILTFSSLYCAKTSRHSTSSGLVITV